MERLTDTIERVYASGPIEPTTPDEARALLRESERARMRDAGTLERRAGAPMSRFGMLLAALGLSRRSSDSHAA